MFAERPDNIRDRVAQVFEVTSSEFFDRECGLDPKDVDGAVYGTGAAASAILRLFCLDCIIATRGYNFREGQVGTSR
jgi:hypothetical protein